MKKINPMKILAGTLLLASLYAPGCSKKTQEKTVFKYEGMTVTATKEETPGNWFSSRGCDSASSYGPFEKSVFKIQNGDSTVIIADVFSDAELGESGLTRRCGEGVKIIKNEKTIDFLFNRSYFSFTVDGVLVHTTKEEDNQMKENYEFLLGRLYNSLKTQRMDELDKTKFLDSLEKKIDEERITAEQQEREKMIKMKEEEVNGQINSLIEKTREVIFDALPKDKKYEEAGSGVLSAERSYNIIRDIDSGTAEVLRLEHLYRKVAVQQIKFEDINKLDSIVRQFGEKYIAVIKKFEVSFTGFDPDETVLQLTTHTNDESSVSESSARRIHVGLLTGVDVNRMGSNAASGKKERNHEYKKEISYKAVGKLAYKIFRVKE